MERLILCGGGHVSLEVAHVAPRLNFALTVVDDRAEFASRKRFPQASRVLAMPFEEALTLLGSGPSDYFVILTRGHAYDTLCLEHILRGAYAYVGMIGSRNKVAAAMHYLTGKGFSREQLAGVHSPVGLSIGAQTPAEIAVSILAELIQVRAALGAELPPPPEEEGVLAVIVKKTGSAPRGAGAWMLLRPDGSQLGSIGGGAVEYQARQDALALWRDGGDRLTRIYDLSQDAAELGMVCGGTLEVQFQVRRRR